MANISDAHGKISLYSNDIKVIESLEKAYYHLKDFCYFTVLSDDKIKADDYFMNDFKYGFKYSFYGAGRWSYDINIENFGKWIEKDIEDKDIKNLLIANDYLIIYDYEDIETSEDIHYKAKVQVIHNSGHPILDQKVQYIEYHDC